LLEVSAVVSGGVLQVTWTFSGQVHRRSTVERLAEGFLTFLKELAGGVPESFGRGSSTGSPVRRGIETSVMERLIGQIDLVPTVIADESERATAGRPLEAADCPPIAAGRASAGIGTEVIEDVYPLSHSQQGMLFESLAGAGAGIHVEQCTCNVTEL
jgi:hypothetical protein